MNLRTQAIAELAKIETQAILDRVIENDLVERLSHFGVELEKNFKRILEAK